MAHRRRLLIAILLAFFGRHHNSMEFLFSFRSVAEPIQPVLTAGEITVPSPLFRIVPGLAALYGAAPPLLLFVLALLQAQWTYTGYDASAHMAEETIMARRNSAWGIVLSVAVSAVAGYLMLMVLTWCIPHGDVAATANDLTVGEDECRACVLTLHWRFSARRRFHGPPT